MKLTPFILVSFFSYFVWTEAQPVTENVPLHQNRSAASTVPVPNVDNSSIPTVKPSSVAFFIKRKGDLLPIGFDLYETKKNNVSYGVVDESNLAPKNFTMAEKLILASSDIIVGESKGRLAFGGDTKPYKFTLHEDGRVLGPILKLCQTKSTQLAIFFGRDHQISNCSYEDIYVLPSYDMKPLESRGFTGTVHDNFYMWGRRRDKDKTYVWYRHGSWSFIVVTDTFLWKLVDVRTTEKSESMNLYKDWTDAWRRAWNCTLGISGPNATEYSKHFMKGYDDECRLFINGQRITRKPGKSWSDSIP